MDLSCNLGEPRWQRLYGRDGGVAIAKQQCQGKIVIAVPPCTCPRCAEQWISCRDQTGFDTLEEVLQAHKRGIQSTDPPRRQYSRVLDNHQATKLLADKMSSIKDDWKYLSSAVHDHGNAILSRWKKKRVTGRVKVLTPLFPTMAHRGWLRERAIGNKITFEDFEKFTAFALQPTLSMDELAQDYYSLIRLIHARTVWTPEQWVAVDRSSTAWAWWQTRHSTFFNPASVCLSGPSYGQLVPLNLASNHAWKTSGFPRALMILESQAHLLRLLSRIVERLLEDSYSRPGNDRWLQLVSHPLCSHCSVETSSPHLRQLFFEPPQQDPARMMHIAKVRLDASADTTWLLQTETACFDRWLSTEGASRSRPLCQTGLTGDYGETIFKLVMLLQSTARWGELHQRCANLRDGLQMMRSTKHYSSVSTVRLREDVQDLDDLLVREMFDHMTFYCGRAAQLLFDVKTTTQEYRGMKAPRLDFHVPANFVNPIDLYPESDADVFSKESPLLLALNEMFNLIRTNADDPPELFESSYARVVCLLERFLLSVDESGKHRRGEVDFVSTVVDIIAFHNLRVCLRMHTTGILPDTKILKRDIAGRHPSQSSFTDIPEHEEDQLARHLRHFQAMPAPGLKQDYEWLSRNDARINALGAFWTSFENAFWCSSDHTSPVTIRIKDLLGAHQEPAHVANLEAERQAVVDRLQREHQDRLGVTPLQTQWGDESVSTLKAEYKRSKKRRKARPSEDQDRTAKIEIPDQLIHALSLAEQKPPNPIEVPRESLLTLQRLFSSSAEDTRGPVHWQSFKKAMGDAGFLVAHRGGSAVEFAKENQGRISVHRPHPEDKLDNIMLLSIGKRMTRHFGWTRETFAERSKAASSDREAALTVSET